MTDKPAETMISRMMKAMNDRAGYTEYGPIIPVSLLEPIAKAALEAVRDMSLDGLLIVSHKGGVAVQNGEVWPTQDSAGALWRAGLDAILDDEA